MSKADDFLIEIGTEELPPRALRSLMEAFGRGLAAAVDEAPLARGEVHSYASPRRLAVLINGLARQQDTRKVEHKGPPLSVAFDKDGSPTPAALAFAKKCGVAVADLGRAKTDKGEWLVFDALEQGKTAAALMPALIERTLASLPIPRRMRWGTGETEFVRPVHWIVMLHGKDVIDGSVLETTAGNTETWFETVSMLLPLMRAVMLSAASLSMTRLLRWSSGRFPWSGASTSNIWRFLARRSYRP
jgi:glycyl-tRNA synthetase beta chain